MLGEAELEVFRGIAKSLKKIAEAADMYIAEKKAANSTGQDVLKLLKLAVDGDEEGCKKMLEENEVLKTVMALEGLNV